MLYESIKVQGNTIVLIPSENLSSMGFGNLGMSCTRIGFILSHVEASLFPPVFVRYIPLVLKEAHQDAK